MERKELANLRQPTDPSSSTREKVRSGLGSRRIGTARPKAGSPPDEAGQRLRALAGRTADSKSAAPVQFHVASAVSGRFAEVSDIANAHRTLLATLDPPAHWVRGFLSRALASILQAFLRTDQDISLRP